MLGAGHRPGGAVKGDAHEKHPPYGVFLGLGGRQPFVGGDGRRAGNETENRVAGRRRPVGGHDAQALAVVHHLDERDDRCVRRQGRRQQFEPGRAGFQTPDDLP